MSFEEALAEYGRLRQAYNSGQLSPQDFAQRVQQLQVRDTGGNYWAIDGTTGGWLRYDGSSWVPGQPPIPQQPTGMAATQISSPQQGGYSQPQQGGFGQQQAGGFGQPQSGGFNQPQQGGFGQQQAGGFGQSQPGGFGQQPMVPSVPAQPAARGRRGLFIGIAAAVGALLVICVVALVALNAAGVLSGGTSGLTEAAMAKSVKDNKQPQDKTTEFVTGDEVYITYTANRVKQGQYVDLKMFRDGTQIQLQDTQTSFEKDATYYGYYSYKPTAKGAYKVELYYNGEVAPSQTLTFNVK